MDKWEEYQAMSADKLMSEIEKMNKILFKMSGSSPMFNQMQGMVNLANQVLQDKFALARLEGEENASTSIEIGNIDSEVNHIDYDQDIMNVVVDSYVSKLRDNKK